MRSIIIALACFGLCAAPAMAQPAPAAASAPLDPATQTPERLDAARNMLSAALIETGAISAAADTAFANVGPQMRQSVQTSAVYLNATSAHRAALDRYLDGVPTVVAAEMNARLPGIVAAGAPQLAAVLSESDMRAAATFLRTPEGKSIFTRYAVAGASESTGGSAAATLTAAEMQAAAAFNASPAGVALNAHSSEFSAIVQSTMQAGFASLLPHFQAKLARDMCAILETECPPQMSAAGQAAN